MSSLVPPQAGSGSRVSARTKEDWEDWEDDEILTPATAWPSSMPDLVPERTGSVRGEATRQQTQQQQLERRTTQRASGSTARQSAQKIERLKSRLRQRAQNENAGITLVTDMSQFRRQQHIAQQMRPIPENRASRTGKFVDAAALKALEGAPSDDFVGTFGWLRRKHTKGKRIERLVADAAPQADLSPSAGPIVIGFAMPSDSDVVISPQTAVVQTPVEFPLYFQPPNVVSPNQPVSAWSPDTDDGTSPRAIQRGYVPAVPSIPQHYRATDASPVSASDNAFTASRARKSFRDTLTTPIYVSDDDEDDMATPVTLFEEDGSPATTQRKSLRVIKGRQRSATAGSAQSQGWWDQVTSPFGPPTPQSPGSGQPKGDESQAWGRDVDKKKTFSPLSLTPEAESSTGPRIPPRIQQRPPEIIVQDLSSPMVLPSKAASTPSQRPQRPPQPEKPRVLAEEVQIPGDLPPPYSPPSKNENVRYRAVFPAGHPLNNMYPPSPGPVPPGLSQTMTSQGAIRLSDVPLTPAPTTPQPRLPDRPPGSYVPGARFVDVSGQGPRQKAERQRRRHEKEDAVAHQAGRFWHGRGCFPCCGCFGRPGREGRKRRRVCLGVCVAVLLLTALGVTLGVLLSRQKAPEASVPSQFLNLTNFPPMPTGISTVIGPDSDARTSCVQPPTLWACALPKEEAGSVAPFDADQPSFVIQIQFDNNTRQSWNVTGDPPHPTPTNTGVALPLPKPTSTKTTSTSTAAATSTASPRVTQTTSTTTSFTSRVRRVLQGRAGSGSSLTLRSDPPPPTFQEMFFLGNTTDGVVSPDKAGEPTPFYISILRTTNDTVGPNLLTRRDGNDGPQTNLTTGSGVVNASDIAPPPLLSKDGTGAPAVLLPFPTQQPLRLYDRGLPTERYFFYTYFNKTTYVRSVEALAGSGATPVPADQNGGSLRAEAKFLVTWLSVRYKVEIWTRMANTTRLLGSGPGSGNATQPGSFPYPVTITLDTHGGERGKKFVFARGVDDRQRIVLNDARFVLNNLNTTGDLANPASGFNPSFGGMDGGTGGCSCEWRNWVGVNGGK